MIVPDINLLVWAEIDAFATHGAARRWWERLLNGERPVGIAPAALLGFIRVTTDRGVLADPLPLEDAIERTQAWLNQPPVTILSPGRRHFDIAFRLLRQRGTPEALTTELQLAALALEHDGEVHSTSDTFGRYEGLRWVNPIAS